MGRKLSALYHAVSVIYRDYLGTDNRKDEWVETFRILNELFKDFGDIQDILQGGVDE